MTLSAPSGMTGLATAGYAVAADWTRPNCCVLSISPSGRWLAEPMGRKVRDFCNDSDVALRCVIADHMMIARRPVVASEVDAMMSIAVSI